MMDERWWEEHSSFLYPCHMGCKMDRLALKQFPCRMRRVASWSQHCRKTPPHYRSPGRCQCGRGERMSAPEWASDGCRQWSSHFWETTSTVRSMWKWNPSRHDAHPLWPRPLARRSCPSPPPPSNDVHAWNPQTPLRSSSNESVLGSSHPGSP